MTDGVQVSLFSSPVYEKDERTRWENPLTRHFRHVFQVIPFIPTLDHYVGSLINAWWALLCFSWLKK